MIERKTSAQFLDSVRLINGKPVPASTWYVLTRGGPKIVLALGLLGIGVLTAFIHPILGAVIGLCAFFVRGPKLFTGWYGSCPACAAELWLPVPKDAPVQGHDCPTCKSRIILRDGAFELAPFTGQRAA